MAAIVVYTENHRIIVPYENVSDALKDARRITEASHESIKLFYIAMDQHLFDPSKIVAMQVIDHNEPAWLREQKALEMANNAKAQNMAQAMLQKAVSLV